MRRHRFHGLIACLLTMSTLLSSCAPLSADKPQSSPAPASNVLMWPPAPEAPRIAWVRGFARPEDLGIKRTFLQRLQDLFFGAYEVRLVRPMAVVVMEQVIYVADPGAKGVHRFDTVSGDYRLLQAADGSPLPSSVGLARCGNDVLVSDSSRAQIFSIAAADAGAHLVSVDTTLLQPTGIACDETRSRVYVSDTAAHQVKIFRRDAGKLVLEKTLGQRGVGAGEFNFPTYLWWSREGRLYVSDALNFRVQMFDEEMHLVGQFGRLGDGSGDAARQKGVATDSQGHVYVVDALFHAFQIFNVKGDFLLSVGARGGDSGEFWLPTGIFIDRDDLIYVADSYNSRIQVFRYLGAAP